MDLFCSKTCGSSLSQRGPGSSQRLQALRGLHCDTRLIPFGFHWTFNERGVLNLLFAVVVVVGLKLNIQLAMVFHGDAKTVWASRSV